MKNIKLTGTSGSLLTSPFNISALQRIRFWGVSIHPSLVFYLCQQVKTQTQTLCCSWVLEAQRGEDWASSQVTRPDLHLYQTFREIWFYCYKVNHCLAKARWQNEVTEGVVKNCEGAICFSKNKINWVSYWKILWVRVCRSKSDKAVFQVSY